MGRERRDDLRGPLQGLLIAPEFGMRDAIHRGEKKITIRTGWRDYEAGRPMLIGCHIAPWAVMSTVTSVRHTTIRELTEDEYRDDGFESREDAVEQLGRFYPDVSMDSRVTVIRWEPETEKSYFVKNPDAFDEREVSRFLENEGG